MNPSNSLDNEGEDSNRNARALSNKRLAQSINYTIDSQDVLNQS
jgi:hypothetical protein